MHQRKMMKNRLPSRDKSSKMKPPRTTFTVPKRALYTLTPETGNFVIVTITTVIALNHKT